MHVISLCVDMICDIDSYRPMFRRNSAMGPSPREIVVAVELPRRLEITEEEGRIQIEKRPLPERERPGTGAGRLNHF